MSKKKIVIFAIVVALLATLVSAFSVEAGVDKSSVKSDLYLSVPTVTPTKTKVIGGVTFNFISVDITKNPIFVGRSILEPTSGYSVLCVHTSYSGDMNNIYPKSPSKVSITIIDKKLVMSGLSGAQWERSKADLCFYVVNDSGPYILRSTDDPSWFFDLTSLIVQTSNKKVLSADCNKY